MDVLYYEKLDISIVELENKVMRQVHWMNGHRQEEVRHAQTAWAGARRTHTPPPPRPGGAMRKGRGLTSRVDGPVLVHGVVRLAGGGGRWQGVFSLLLEKTDAVSALFDQLKGKVAMRGDANKKIKTDVASPPGPPAVPTLAPSTTSALSEPAPHAGADAVPMTTSEDDASPPPVAAPPVAAPMDEDHDEEVCGDAPVHWRRGTGAVGGAQHAHARPPPPGLQGRPVDQGTGQLRLYQVYNSKITAVWDGSRPVNQLLTYDTIVVEVRATTAAGGGRGLGMSVFCITAIHADPPGGTRATPDAAATAASAVVPPGNPGGPSEHGPQGQAGDRAAFPPGSHWRAQPAIPVPDQERTARTDAQLSRASLC